jgi:Berberine and berberine like
MSATLRIAARDDVEAAPAVELAGAMLGGESETRELLGDLVAAAGHDPASAAHEEMPYREVKRTLAGSDAAEPAAVLLKSELFRRPLPREALDELVRTLTADRRPGESRELAFTPLGGAYVRVAPDATAYAHRGEHFLFEHTATVGDSAPETARAWLSASWRTAHPWSSGRVYPNFPDPDLDHWAEAYHGANHPRLAAVKRTYDPGNLFRFPQGLASPR